MAVLAGVVGVTFFWVIQTRAMIAVWRSEETMWRHVLQYYPRAGIAHLHLALALIDQRQFTLALPHITYAATVIPDNPSGRSAAGLVWLHLGRYKESAAESRASLELDPTMWASRYNLACALVQLGELSQGYEQLYAASQLNRRAALYAQKDPLLKPLREEASYTARIATWAATGPEPEPAERGGP